MEMSTPDLRGESRIAARRRHFVVHLCVGLISIAMTAVPLIAKAGSLFADASSGSLHGYSSDPTVLRERAVTVDLGALVVSSKSIDAPLFQLFSDIKFTALLHRSEKNRSGSVTWTGSLEGLARSSVTLVSKKGVLVGNIRTPDLLFEVGYLGGDLHVIRQIDPTAFPDELPPEEIELNPSAMDAAAMSSGSDDGSLIDMMVVYTSAARIAAGGTTAIQNTIDLAMAETNTGYANSNVVPRVNLVHTEETSYAGSGNLGLDRNRLKGKADGYMDGLHATRDAVNADIVSLIQENGGGYCGIAYIMTTVSTAFEEFGFNVTARNCATGYFSFGHELGHIQGARHDWYVDGTNNSPYTYNHGFVDPSDHWRTVMAYGNDCGGCTRIDYWSNPNVNDPVYGDPMGVSEGSFQAAENWKTLNNTAYTVANFREGANCSAGTLSLDSLEYSCSGLAQITVSDCDLNTSPVIIQSAFIDIISTSELSGEVVQLTETGPNSNDFVGTISLSTSNLPGVLLVKNGDGITATYLDVDDGEGGTNVNVLADAAVDCQSPVISNVVASSITGTSATIGFDTDELTDGKVNYGSSCGSLSDNASQAGPLTSHAIPLASLSPSQTYYYEVIAEDGAGNITTDDNGGACFSFATSTLSDDYFSELFLSSDNDLDYLSLTFTPDNSIRYYCGGTAAIGALPIDPSGGTPLSLGDDSYANVALSGETVSLYGASYSSFYVGSNGYITFDTGDISYAESFSTHFAMRRISALYVDLNPVAGGSVSWKQLADRAVVTWDSIRRYGANSTNTFQVELHFDGTIVISYLDLAVTEGLSGLSEGNGVPSNFVESDLSAQTCRGSDIDGDGIPDAVDNCTHVPNPDQCDSNLDGLGNRCDPDSSNDGDVGITDFNDLRSYFGQTCFEPFGACADVDYDCDGAVGIQDFNTLRTFFGGSPGPSGLVCAGIAPCPASACPHDECTVGAALHPACSDCAEAVCAIEPACCISGWDAVCVDEVISQCGLSCASTGDTVDD